MNHERNINKMRILSLLTLAENSKEIPFDLLQSELQIEVDDIESFVIDGKYEESVCRIKCPAPLLLTLVAVLRRKMFKSRLD